MESTISADVIYHYVAKLQREGLSDDQIKKNLVSGVLEEESMLQLLQKEALFIQKTHKKAFKKRNFIFSALGFVAVYLILNPFLSEKASQIVFLVLALGLASLVAIRLRSLYL